MLVLKGWVSFAIRCLAIKLNENLTNQERDRERKKQREWINGVGSELTDGNVVTSLFYAWLLSFAMSFSLEDS